MFDFIKKHLQYPLNAPSESWEDRNFCLTAIILKRNALRMVPRRFWQEHDFCMAAIQRNSEAIEWISNEYLEEAKSIIKGGNHETSFHVRF
jgi:hypothetical protein